METAVVTLVGQVATGLFGFLGSKDTNSAAVEQARLKNEADVKVATLQAESANRLAAVQLEMKKLEIEVAKDAQHIQLEVAKMEADHKTREFQIEMRQKLAGEQDNLIASKYTTVKAEQSAKLEVSNQQIVAQQSSARNAAIALAEEDERNGVKLIPASALKIDPKPMSTGPLSEVLKASYRGCPVAIKRFKQTLSASKHELEGIAVATAAARKLQHPNVVTFIGACVDSDKRLCLVLELVAGIDLDAFLHIHKRVVPMGMAYRMGLELARTLEFVCAHAAAHGGPGLRDLTSANVILYGGSNLKVTCIDWIPAVRAYASITSAQSTNAQASAVAVHTATGKTLTKARATRPEWYTAPEVLKCDDILYSRTASAVYSFSILMQEIVSGFRPFSEHKTVQSVADLLEQLTRPKHPLRPTFSAAISKDHAAFVQLLMRCWDSKPHKRPVLSEIVTSFEEFVAVDAAANPIPLSQKSKSVGIALAKSTGKSVGIALAKSTGKGGAGALMSGGASLSLSQSGKVPSSSVNERLNKKAAQKETEQKQSGIHSIKSIKSLTNKTKKIGSGNGSGSGSGGGSAVSKSQLKGKTLSGAVPSGSLHVSTKEMKFCPKCGHTASQLGTAMSLHIQNCSA